MSTLCIDCGHRHRGSDQCPHCDCHWDEAPIVLTNENNMIKKIWNKIKSWIKKII